MARETELYKDKIEVSLDGRQIFYLFFGGAVVVGLVFVLGVMVGRRAEARGHVERANVAATVDPLAALDRLEGGSALSFEGSLRGTPQPSEVEKTIAQKAAATAAAAADKAPHGAQAAPAKAQLPAEAKDEAKAESKKDETKSEAKKDEQKADGKLEKKIDKSEAKDSKAEKKADKLRFTLQLSSFQDRTEAQTFLDSVKAGGFAAYLTEGEVDGKTFYRVRLGTYRTIEAANDAKADFEKSAKKSAQVMKL